LHDGWLELIDQTRLPTEFVHIQCRDLQCVYEAIRWLRVRGAPAIGVVAAFGVVLGIREAPDEHDAFFRQLEEVIEHLSSARPTAVNLFWALSRMRAKAESLRSRPVSRIKEALLKEALAIQAEDAEMCRAIGRAGAALLPDNATVLTHCNAGSLATAEYGTALAIIYAAAEQGKSVRVYADETRPLLQGARLTAWELKHASIDVTVICDSAAGWLMRQGRIDAVVVGADRIAANGDTANKIGTYCLAVLAQRHGVPFYVAAPSSTFDLGIPDGSHIPIEQRPESEVAEPFGLRIVPTGVPCYNPAFDVTPAELITAIVTEKGIIRPVNSEQIGRILSGR